MNGHSAPLTNGVKGHRHLTAKQRAAVKAASHDVLPSCVKFLQDIVKVDTTNPPGLAYREVSDVIAAELQRLKYNHVELLVVDQKDLAALAPHDTEAHERVNVLGRLLSTSKTPNLIKTAAGTERQKTIHFNGHTDVVPTGDLTTWTVDPFGGVVKDGSIYGRGVSDMKGGIAAGIFAVEAIRKAGLVLKGTVEQTGVVDEESTGVRNAGAGWLVEQGIVSPESVDGVVITEPLNVENVCLGHRGAIWGTITFHGLASHGATPQRGINALVHAARFVVKATDTIVKDISQLREERVIPPEARGASLTFTVLKAGANTNSVPDIAVVKFDRRLVPSETLEKARNEISSVLAELKNEVPEVKFTYEENYSTEPVWINEDCEIVDIWKQAVDEVVIKSESNSVKAGKKAEDVFEKVGIVCSPGSDDQRFFVRGGIPQTIVYGPGNIRNVHNCDESLSLEDLRLAVEVMACGIAEFLGVDEEI